MKMPELKNADGTLRRAVNLRPVVNDCRTAEFHNQPLAPALVPVGVPKAIETKWRAVTWATMLDGATYTFLISGNQVAVKRGSQSPVPLCTLPGRMLCVSPGYYGHVHFMTKEGRVTVRFDGKSWVPEPRDGDAAIAFVVDAVATHRATVGTITLSQKYDAGSDQLCDTDASRVSRALVEAYRTLSVQARQSGNYLQPVAVYARIVDANGATLHVTPPVIVSHYSGLQGTDALSMDHDGADRPTLNTATLEATSYRLSMDLNHWEVADWLGRGAMLRVYVSPQLHPVVPSAPLPCNINNRNPQVKRFAFHLPGTDSAQADLAQAVHGLMAQVDTVDKTHRGGPWRCIATYPIDELDSSARRVALPVPAIDFDTEATMLGMLRGVDVEPDMSLTAMCMAPHSFSAEGVSANGRVTAWHTVEPLRFAGYSPIAYTIGFDTRQVVWRAQASVTFADGAVVAQNDMGTANAPTALSPLIAYPSADVSTFEMGISLQGATFTEPGTPRRAGRWSYYLRPNLKPWLPAVSTPALVQPATNIHTAPRPSSVALASSTAPTLIRASDCPVDVPIIAICPHSVAASAWGQGQAGFFLFTHRGIFSLTSTRSIDQMSARLYDSRVLAAPAAIAATPSGIMAVAGGDLVLLSRGHAPKTLLAGVGNDITAMAWIPSRHEVWLTTADINHDTPCLAVSFDPALPQGRCYLRTVATAGAFADVVATPHSVLAYDLDREALVDLNDEQPAHVHIEYGGTLSYRNLTQRLRRVVLQMYSPAFRGNVRISHNHDGQNYGYDLLNANIDGPVLAPLTVGAFVHPTLYVNTLVSATVHPDTVITRLHLA